MVLYFLRKCKSPFLHNILLPCYPSSSNYSPLKSFLPLDKKCDFDKMIKSLDQFVFVKFKKLKKLIDLCYNLNHQTACAN